MISNCCRGGSDSRGRRFESVERAGESQRDAVGLPRHADVRLGLDVEERVHLHGVR